MLAHVRDAETVHALIEGLVHGAVEYEIEGRTWRHSFAMRAFAGEAELRRVLAEAGLRLERSLDARWFLASAELRE